MGRKTFYVKMGRPTKLTPKARKAFCDARSIGAPYKACAAYAGIAESSAYSYLAAAKTVLAEVEENPDRVITDEEKAYVQFLEAVWEAEATAAITWQQVVHAAAQQEPEWAWRMLERWYPGDFKAPPQQHELTGADGGDIQHTMKSTVSIVIPDNGRGDTTVPVTA